jgi:hypothetical protein
VAKAYLAFIDLASLYGRGSIDIEVNRRIFSDLAICPRSHCATRLSAGSTSSVRLFFSPNPWSFALANKIARMAWALLCKGEVYRPPLLPLAA